MKAFSSSLPIALALGVALLAALATVPARAGLGDKADSAESDRMSMKGQLRERSEPGYSVEEITAGTGTVVREYVSSSGVVFAVSWYGPAMPNLQQAFGSYFTQFQSAVASQRARGIQHRGHSHLEIHTSALIVHAGGHMRQYFGIAYVPSLMPQNLSVSDLH